MRGLLFALVCTACIVRGAPLLDAVHGMEDTEMEVLRLMLLHLTSPSMHVNTAPSLHKLSRPHHLQMADEESQKPGRLRQLLGRFRAKREVEAAPQISVGSALPEVDVEVVGAGGTGTAMTLSDAISNGTALLVGMPGAFTQTCTREHLPSILDNLDELGLQGVVNVAVLTTNDRFVNAAWRDVVMESTERKNAPENNGTTLSFLSDADGEAIKALGLIDDMGFGMGVRSKRFTLVTKDNLVEYVGVDEGMDVCDKSSITSALKFLTPAPVKEIKKVEEKDAAIAVGVAAILALGAYAATTPGVLEKFTQ